MQLFRIARAKDAPGPGILMLKLRGSHEMARGHSVELELDPDDAGLLADLRHVYEVEPIEARTPRLDPERKAFLSGDHPPMQASTPDGSARDTSPADLDASRAANAVAPVKAAGVVTPNPVDTVAKTETKE